MSLETQWDALYRLFYKRDVRAAFSRGTMPDGLTRQEIEQFRSVPADRLNVVVGLHAPDIGGWYRPRVPATWLALQATLECDERELVQRLTASDAFELRVNDDEGCLALNGFIHMLSSRHLKQSPWLADLLRYELLTAGSWPDERSPRVETFRYDVEGIRRALLEQSLCPLGEKSREIAILFHRGASEIGEAALNTAQAKWLAAHVSGKVPQGDASLKKRCLGLLKAVGASLLLAITLISYSGN